MSFNLTKGYVLVLADPNHHRADGRVWHTASSSLLRWDEVPSTCTYRVFASIKLVYTEGLLLSNPNQAATLQYWR